MLLLQTSVLLIAALRTAAVGAMARWWLRHVTATCAGVAPVKVLLNAYVGTFLHVTKRCLCCGGRVASDANA